jgi:tetratricopeptide (TPR) repeat protein
MPIRKSRSKKKKAGGTRSGGKGEAPQLADLEALVDVLETILGSDATDDDLDRAQELVYKAWEAGTAKQRVSLAKKALKISPLCADAYVLLAEHAERGSDAQLELWQSGVAAGEAAVGELAFEEDVGHFWGILETRPYMRARFGLAMALWARDARDEALGHLRDMLRLNPNDNQGLRYVLAASLLELGRDEELNALLKTYEEDGTAAWTWTMALAAFRRVGDGSDSRRLLAEAVAGNAHVQSYLLGERQMPKTLPHLISLGGKDEAISYMDEFGEGWKQTPGALDWLRQQGDPSKTVA